MPEYDPTDYPEPLAPNLTGGEIGREPTELPSAWPASRHLPEAYDGPPPAREFETSGGPRRSGTVLAPDPAPSEKPQTSIAPPPGHTAQP